MPEGTVTPKKKRIISIDLLRGLVIILMALDHVREFFSSARFSPTDLSQTNLWLFLTRWVTHFCAPVFIFLAGTSAFLYQKRGRSKTETARFLLTRGLFLIVLEFTVIRFAVTFNFDYFSPASTVAQVIWVIGISMVFLAALVFLPNWLITSIGILLIAFHNLFDRGDSAPYLSWLWVVLHEPHILTLPFGVEIKIAYPAIPWVGVMALGYTFGNTIATEEGKRRKTFFWIGLSAVVGFVLIRALNIYGDPLRWTLQENPLFSALSFLNCTKYPPSLLFLLMTMGPALIILSFLSERETPLAKFLLVYGRVPLFFYILHFFLMHCMAILLAFIRYGTIPSWLFINNPVFTTPPFPWGPTDYGYSLWVVYLIWLAVVFLLYPACKWYMDFKKSHSYPWLSYI